MFLVFENIVNSNFGPCKIFSLISIQVYVECSILLSIIR